jgi:hypothetical protein
MQPSIWRWRQAYNSEPIKLMKFSAKEVKKEEINSLLPWARLELFRRSDITHLESNIGTSFQIL